MGPFYWKKNSKQKFPLFDLIPPSMLLLPTITIWQAPAHLKKFSILIVYIPFCLATEATIMLCIFYVPIQLCLLYALTFPFFDLPYFIQINLQLDSFMFPIFHYYYYYYSYSYYYFII